MTLEEARMDPTALRAELEPMARENVKGRWILEAIADQNGIEVSEEELESALGRMAEGFKVATEDLKRYILSREGSLEGIRRQLREDKALDLVYREAVFV
jgi:trigger factor